MQRSTKHNVLRTVLIASVIYPFALQSKPSADIINNFYLMKKQINCLGFHAIPLRQTTPAILHTMRIHSVFPSFSRSDIKYKYDITIRKFKSRYKAKEAAEDIARRYKAISKTEHGKSADFYGKYLITYQADGYNSFKQLPYFQKLFRSILFQPNLALDKKIMFSKYKDINERLIVAHIQSYLVRNSFAKGLTINGTLDKKTIRAINRFYKKNNIKHRNTIDINAFKSLTLYPDLVYYYGSDIRTDSHTESTTFRTKNRFHQYYRSNTYYELQKILDKLDFLAPVNTGNKQHSLKTTIAAYKKHYNLGSNTLIDDKLIEHVTNKYHRKHFHLIRNYLMYRGYTKNYSCKKITQTTIKIAGKK